MGELVFLFSLAAVLFGAVTIRRAVTNSPFGSLLQAQRED
jgi:ABC-type branched-subunit amino acid transport system permease subunit